MHTAPCTCRIHPCELCVPVKTSIRDISARMEADSALVSPIQDPAQLMWPSRAASTCALPHTAFLLLFNICQRSALLSRPMLPYAALTRL